MTRDRLRVDVAPANRSVRSLDPPPPFCAWKHISQGSLSLLCPAGRSKEGLGYLRGSFLNRGSVRVLTGEANSSFSFPALEMETCISWQGWESKLGVHTLTQNNPWRSGRWGPEGRGRRPGSQGCYWHKRAAGPRTRHDS